MDTAGVSSGVDEVAGFRGVVVPDDAEAIMAFELDLDQVVALAEMGDLVVVALLSKEDAAGIFLEVEGDRGGGECGEAIVDFDRVIGGGGGFADGGHGHGLTLRED